MDDPIYELETESGENLHVCASREGLYIAAHDGTEGGGLELTVVQVAHLWDELGAWLQRPAPTPQRCTCAAPDWYHDGFEAQVVGRICRTCRGREGAR